MRIGPRVGYIIYFFRFIYFFAHVRLSYSPPSEWDCDPGAAEADTGSSGSRCLGFLRKLHRRYFPTSRWSYFICNYRTAIDQYIPRCSNSSRYAVSTAFHCWLDKHCKLAVGCLTSRKSIYIYFRRKQGWLLLCRPFRLRDDIGFPRFPFSSFAGLLSTLRVPGLESPHDPSFPLPSSMWKFEGFGGFCNVEWVGILGPRFCRASNMWLVRTLFAPLASFCRWLFLKNIFGLMSSTVGIAVSVIVPSIWGRGGGEELF